MKTFALALWLTLLTLFGLPAFAADMIASNGSERLMLHDTPCAKELLEMLEADVNVIVLSMDTSKAHAATYGTSLRACWVMTPAGDGVYLRYEDGDAGVVPLAAFKPVEKL